MDKKTRQKGGKITLSSDELEAKEKKVEVFPLVEGPSVGGVATRRGVIERRFKLDKVVVNFTSPGHFVGKDLTQFGGQRNDELVTAGHHVVDQLDVGLLFQMLEKGGVTADPTR